MYRFTVNNNVSGHKPIVVAAVTFVLLCLLFLHTLTAQLTALISISFSAYFIIQKVQSLQPLDGIVLLEQQAINFTNATTKINGNISPKTCIIGDNIYLCVQGVSRRQWLVLTVNSIDEQSLARLRRAILNAC
ncbi:MAG: hypothetical protein ACTJH9_04245 [Pseudoalteromonas sp.]|uniref:hypothetical protein n=1 Tax=unclassified Pseudoalteromonas TaxID=194690 RepID=UPI003F9E1019